MKIRNLPARMQCINLRDCVCVCVRKRTERKGLAQEGGGEYPERLREARGPEAAVRAPRGHLLPVLWYWLFRALIH